ncbi:hypothetical protein [Angelakisella massiliensis]|uniref:hypothetical protein n=1 Tax=Angelakisella massiliensis TaxID=1871018 RepID=UPI0008F95421|nr:hypothetical protein [Angelakisella massiliensis]
MNRDRSYYRRQRQRTIKRKKHLLLEIGGQQYLEGWTGGVPGRLAKGKIHCSCPLCRLKFQDQPSHRDRKRMERIRWSAAEQQTPERFLTAGSGNKKER